jgi:recombination protein RecA
LHEVDASVVEYVDEGTGEVEYDYEGHCDCYSRGVFEAIRFPNETWEEHHARVKRYEENSYEPYRIALIDMEGAFDCSWAAKLGLDDRTIVYARPDTAEEAIDLYDSLMRTGAVDLFILDSIAALTPSKEVEESVEKWQQGLQARLVNKFCRKVQASSNSVAREYGRAPTQIWINQVREKIGVMFGSPETVPGGRGQGFATSVELKLWANDFDKESIDLVGKDKMEMATRVRINFKTEKNKTAPPKRTGSYVMSLKDGSIDDAKLIYSLAEKIGEVRKISNTKWMLGEQEFRTKTEMMKALNTPEELSRLREEIIKRTA